MIEDESFPVMKIDLHRKAPMPETQMEALVRFFTTPPEHGMNDTLLRQCAPIAPNKIRIRLAFGREHTETVLLPGCVQRLEGMLTRVYASPTRQFAMDELDLSCLKIDAAQLAVVAHILKKNREVYQIEQVLLNNATPRRGPTERNEGLLKVITAACDANLKRLDISSNRVDIEQIATLCSALRYGCQIETIDLHSALFYPNDADEEQCWRWLAYAIFYSRSKKLAAENTSRHIEIGENCFDSSCCNALVKTLSDPARELVYRGKSDSGAPKDELLLLTIKRGAKFYADPQVTQEHLHQLGHEKVLEALCEQEGWACVVVPGIGFGWVARDQIVSVEWGFKGMFAYEEKSDEALPSFSEHVGCYLSYLSLEGSWVGSCRRRINKLATVLRHCVNLQHLLLCDSDLLDVDVNLLGDMLDGDLGDQLLSLDLNENDISSAGINRVSAFLANRARSPALTELQIHFIPLEYDR